MPNKSKPNNHKQKPKNEVAQPHDATFKKLFGKPQIAKDVIAQNLPQEILNDMDLDSLEKLDGSFISEKLKETFTDIVYGVNIKGRDAYIALLLEHKSYTDQLAIFQVSRYIIDLWAKTIESGKKELPIVIPIIVYHGKGQWNYKKDTRNLIPGYDALPAYLKDRLPVLRHDFINITGHNENDMKKYKPLTRMVMRSFKYISGDTDELVEAFLISMEEVDISDEELYSIVEILFIYYSAANKQLTEEEILRKIRELDGKGGKIMTILQEREMKGIEKGKLESARRFLSMKLTVEQVAEGTNLSIEEVKRLKEELEEFNKLLDTNKK